MTTEGAQPTVTALFSALHVATFVVAVDHRFYALVEIARLAFSA